MKAYAHKNLSRRAIEVLLVDESHGKTYVAEPCSLVMREVKGLEETVTPTLLLPYAAAQSLLQALWDEGLRPDSGEGAAGQVAALKAHVQFAERVAYRLLPKEVP